MSYPEKKQSAFKLNISVKVRELNWMKKPGNKYSLLIVVNNIA